MQGSALSTNGAKTEERMNVKNALNQIAVEKRKLQPSKIR